MDWVDILFKLCLPFGMAIAGYVIPEMLWDLSPFRDKLIISRTRHNRLSFGLFLIGLFIAYT